MTLRPPVAALIRYRFLSTIRRSHWLFGLTAFLVAAPDLMIIQPTFGREAGLELRLSAIAAILCSIAHLFTLVAACGAYGTPKEHREGARPDDLLESAPVRPADLFWADAFGVFSVVMAVHLCVLPMTAFTFASNPLGLTGLLILEGTVVATLFLASSGAAWMLRGSASTFSSTRGVQSTAMFLVFSLTILTVTTRWENFRDAVPQLFREPSPARARQLLAAIDHPLGFIVSFAALYAGYIAFFYWDSIRVTRAGNEY